MISSNSLTNMLSEGLKTVNETPRPETSKLYTFKVYPEHLGDEPIQAIIECLSGYCYAVSPLHNMDCNPNGELVKPHYHINIEFRAPITLNSAVRRLSDAFNLYGGDIVGNFCGNGSVQAARGTKNILDRYLYHLDHPDKFQYDTDEGYCSSGYVVDLTDSREDTTTRVMNLLFDCPFESIMDLLQYCRINHFNKEASYILNHYNNLSFVLKEFNINRKTNEL